MATKISIAEALKLVTVSKTTLYRDLKENKLSSTTDAKGKKVIDTAELERFYGQLKSPSVNGDGKQWEFPKVTPTEQNGTHGESGIGHLRTQWDYGTDTPLSSLFSKIR